MKPLALSFLSVVLLAVLAPAAQAAVVISNLDPANPDFGFNAPTIGQSILTGNRPISLTSVQLLQTGGFTAGESLSVRARNANGMVGATLFTAFTLAYDSASQVTTATVSGAFTLQAASGYFFVLSTGTTSNLEWSYTSSTDYAAAFGATIPTANSSFFTSGATTTYYTLANGPQQIQVNGIAGPAVPEPSTWALLGFGGLGVCVLARRRACGA